MKYWIAFLSLVGIVVASLALRVHYSTGFEICSINEKWDCGVVNHSPFAVFHGVPVAAIGIAGYVLLLVFSLLKKRAIVLLGALAGLGFSLYLTNIEAHVLEVYCIYCVTSLGLISIITLSSLVWLVTGRKSA